MNINKLSDFKLNEKFEVVDMTTPFKFDYFIYPNKSYTASFDGKDYENCYWDGDTLVVVFDNHNLGVGRLKCERKYYLTDSDFKDGIYNKVSVDDTGVILTSGKTDDFDFETTVPPPYIKGDKGDKGDTGEKGEKGDQGAKGDKGDTMTWSTMTESEQKELTQSVIEGLDNPLTAEDSDDVTDYNDVF